MPINLTRSLLAVLIPGLVSIMPWVILAGLHFNSLQGGYHEFAFVLNVMGFAIVVVVGALCQSIGSYAERRWDDERDEEYRVDHYWYAYLALNCAKDAVGFRYISRLATSMFFELSMMTASVFFAIGFGILLASLAPSQWILWSALGIGSGIASALAFRKQARDTHQTLCVTRQELVDRLGAATP